MRIFAVSDIHVDYDVNMKWIQGLSQADYQDDLLILAGDVSHSHALLARSLGSLSRKFRKVQFVPGNHDLWVLGESSHKTSLQKFLEVAETVKESGVSMEPQCLDGTMALPLLGWYDYSFGEPSDELKSVWMDFRACRWPKGLRPVDIALHFERMNRTTMTEGAAKLITYSHFLPRIDLLPMHASLRHPLLGPVLGSTRIESQLRRLKPAIHVYGHSHVNRCVSIDGITYVNNALGYPHEGGIAARRLLRIDLL